MLPDQYSVDDRGVKAVQEACILICQVTGRRDYGDQREALLRAFAMLTEHHDIHPALHGTVLGLLYGADPGWKARIDGVIRGYLKGTPGRMLQSAAFLQGLFWTARDLLLTDPEFLQQVDGLLCELSDDDFSMLLPELRLAFSYFTPMETDRLAAQAVSIHGGNQKLRHAEAVDAVSYTWGEAVDAWAAAQMDEWGSAE